VCVAEQRGKGEEGKSVETGGRFFVSEGAGMGEDVVRGRGAGSEEVRHAGRPREVMQGQGVGLAEQARLQIDAMDLGPMEDLAHSVRLQLSLVGTPFQALQRELQAVSDLGVPLAASMCVRDPRSKRWKNILQEEQLGFLMLRSSSGTDYCASPELNRKTRKAELEFQLKNLSVEDEHGHGEFRLFFQIKGFESDCLPVLSDILRIKRQTPSYSLDELKLEAPLGLTTKENDALKAQCATARNEGAPIMTMLRPPVEIYCRTLDGRQFPAFVLHIGWEGQIPRDVGDSMERELEVIALNTQSVVVCPIDGVRSYMDFANRRGIAIVALARFLDAVDGENSYFRLLVKAKTTRVSSQTMNLSVFHDSILRKEEMPEEFVHFPVSRYQKMASKGRATSEESHSHNNGNGLTQHRGLDGMANLAAASLAVPDKNMQLEVDPVEAEFHHATDDNLLRELLEDGLDARNLTVDDVSETLCMPYLNDLALWLQGKPVAHKTFLHYAVRFWIKHYNDSDAAAVNLSHVPNFEVRVRLQVITAMSFLSMSPRAFCEEARLTFPFALHRWLKEVKMNVIHCTVTKEAAEWYRSLIADRRKCRPIEALSHYHQKSKFRVALQQQDRRAAMEQQGWEQVALSDYEGYCRLLERQQIICAESLGKLPEQKHWEILGKFQKEDIWSHLNDSDIPSGEKSYRFEDMNALQGVSESRKRLRELIKSRTRLDDNPVDNDMLVEASLVLLQFEEPLAQRSNKKKREALNRSSPKSTPTSKLSTSSVRARKQGRIPPPPPPSEIEGRFVDERAAITEHLRLHNVSIDNVADFLGLQSDKGLRKWFHRRDMHQPSVREAGFRITNWWRSEFVPEQAISGVKVNQEE